MKSFAFLALSAVALAAPLLERRAQTVYETIVEEVFETTTTTTTIYVDPTDLPSSVIGAFYENQPASAPAPVPTTSTTSAPAYTAPPAAAPKVEAPVAAPSAAPYVAPVVAAPEVKPAPSVAAAPTVPAAPPAAYTPPAASIPAAAPSTGGSYSGGGGKGDHTGDMTYYDVEVGLGSCGTTATNSENVVALSYLDMKNGANPNANPLCGKTINIYSDTGVHTAKVFDTCPACAQGSLDLPEPLFKLIAPNGDGRVKGVSWSFA
jgi:hypothetical protein